MRRLIQLIVLAASAYAQQLLISGTGSVDGTVIGADGSVIAGAAVVLHRVAWQTPFKRGQVDDWAATSGSGGAFTFERVNDGFYRLCAQAPGGWLDPCDWGLPVTTTSLSLGQKPANVTLAMQRSAALQVRIDDPGNLIPRIGTLSGGSYLMLGATSSTSVFHSLQQLSVDATGRTYQIVIPFNTPVQLVVASSLMFADSSGSPLVSGVTARIPVIAPSGGSVPLVRLTVMGAKP